MTVSSMSIEKRPKLDESLSDNHIKEGDSAVILLSSNDFRYIFIKSEAFTTTQFGKLEFKDLIGKRYGVKIELKKGFIRIIKLNPRIWSKVILHKTQIIYPTDCSFIVTQLDLKPGKVVFEAGTGSASLTHFLIHAVKPSGKVITSEFHSDRAQLAQKDLDEHNLTKYVIVNHRDVINEGLPSILDENGGEYLADAVILDMPSPCNVIMNLDAKFHPDRLCRICVFLPCIEQVQKASSIMRENNYCDIETYEVLLRNHKVSKAQLGVPNMGQGSLEFTQDSFNLGYIDGCQLGSFPHLESQFTIPGNEKTAFLNMVEPEKKMPGHTGFLTFGTKLPQSKKSLIKF